jgi:hypothetical protein
MLITRTYFVSVARFTRVLDQIDPANDQGKIISSPILEWLFGFSLPRQQGVRDEVGLYCYSISDWVWLFCPRGRETAH